MLDNKTKVPEPIEDLSTKIGALFSGLYNQMKTQAELALAESFDVWMLDVNDLSEERADYTFAPQKSELQYHQIKLGDKAAGYAISKPLDSGLRDVFQAALSVVAKRLDKAIDRLEEEDKQNPSTIEVRLVVVPACWVYAFWMVECDQVYLFSAPYRFKRLRKPRPLSTHRFLRLLKDELSPFQPLAEQPTMRW